MADTYTTRADLAVLRLPSGDCYVRAHDRLKPRPDGGGARRRADGSLVLTRRVHTASGKLALRHGVPLVEPCTGRL